MKSFDCSEKPHEPHGVYQEIILCQVNNVEKPSTNVMTLDIDDEANSIQTIDYVCRTETQSGNGIFDLYLLKNPLKLKLILIFISFPKGISICVIDWY